VLLMAAARPRLLLLAALAVVLALAGGLVLGRSLSAPAVERVDDPVSLGFLRDMTTHHAQAVRMSEIAHRRSDSPDLNPMAFDILSTQQGQIGIMSGWLDLWQQSQRGSAEPMRWMGHAGPMPGMAAPADIAELDTLPLAGMEEQWLRLMIRHHRGAVPMAEAAARQADSPQVAGLAERMSAGQQSEIDAMQDMLRARGLAPEPDPSGHAGAEAPSTSTSSPSHDGH
jgi:uncharacterized protein (DUF305 family)